MSTIWQACNGAEYIKPLQQRATRIVESQEQAATMALVDNADEQHLLEQLLDRTKPPPPPEANDYHYLIWTPFRYPPLPYGSRFGQRAQRGIFYASLQRETALAECAYYRFVFLQGMETPLPNERLTTAHTTFEVSVEIAFGVDLCSPPFDAYVDAICHPLRYDETQILGAELREARVAAFMYPSARDPRRGANIAALELAAIASREPENRRSWLCTTTMASVSFIETHSNKPPLNFAATDFQIAGRLPVPAC